MSPPKRRRRRPDGRRSAPTEAAEVDAARAEAHAPPRLLDPARRLALAASITVVGLGLVGVGESDMGAVAVLVGLLFFAFAIHTYGRLGVERRDA